MPEAEKEKVFICPICKKEYKGTLQVTYENGVATCRHDVKIEEDSIEKRRKENLAKSMAAMKLAAEMKATVPEEKMVTVTSYQNNSMGKTEQVPERVLKSLEEKAKTVEELQ